MMNSVSENVVLSVRKHDFFTPQVMGILNVTPDSFFEGSRKQTEHEIAFRADEIIAQGGRIIDVGGFSTRPGANEVGEAEEMRRLRFALQIVRSNHPNVCLSVDTFRPKVAQMAVEEFGADIINDVSEGGKTGIVDTPLCGNDEDIPEMFRMVARLKVSYILMSVQPSMEKIKSNFVRELAQLKDLGHTDVILDPGYGFGKTIEGNYEVLKRQKELLCYGLPLLAGVSRKRMIWQLLDSSPDKALNGTTVINTMALMNGASILRVHDVREAYETIKITEQCLSR